MPLLMPRALLFYRFATLLGLAIIGLTLYFAYQKVESFESGILTDYEQSVMVRMELDGLQEELDHINRVVKKVPPGADEKQIVEVDGITYSNYEVERLRRDRSNLLLTVQEKKLEFESAKKIREKVIQSMLITFGLTLLFCVAGIVISIMGTLGWLFKVELFEDRRQTPR